MKKSKMLPIQYWLYKPFTEVVQGRRIVNAPQKCCMRCVHTERLHCVNEEDFLVCDVNGNCKHPSDWCLSFIKRKSL